MCPSTDGPSLTRYPWSEWTDGEAKLIYQGEDYTISTFNMQISLHGHARAHGLRVSTRSFKESSRDAHGLLITTEGLKFEFRKEEQ